MRKARLFISLLRIALGWVFLYQGISAWRTPGWTIAPLIKNPQTFAPMYRWFLQATIITSASLVIKILFIVVGALLILGMFGRIASLLGIIMMLFFYLPLLHFPYVGTSYFLVDDHIIYSAILAYLFVTHASEHHSIGRLFRFA